MAEIYYTTRVSGRTSSAAAWSRASGYPALLATGLSTNAVGIYTEEGRPLDPRKEALITNVRSTECARLAWHPLLMMLAIGWKDGAVSFWNFEERRLEEDSKTHRSPVTSLTWTPSGDRLVSTDENGKLSMWKTDRNMRPIHLVSYEEQPGSKVKLVALGPAGPAPDTGFISTTVYYGVNTGGKTILKVASDQGYQGIVQDMTEEVTGLIYYAEKEQLVVVGASCSLYLLGKTEVEDQWTVISKMKFSTGTSDAAGSLQVCWAAQHTLASASEKDSMVRMYNFETEDNYILPVEPPEGSGNVTRIVCLATDPRYGLLAAGSADGFVTVFKFTPPAADGEPVIDLAKCWEAQPAFDMNPAVSANATAPAVHERPQSIEWGPNPRLMCVASKESGVYVSRKSLLQHCFRDGMVVIQAGVDKLLVEQIATAGHMQPGKLTVSMQVLGMDASRNQVLVHDGARAEVYRVNEATNESQLADSFECDARSMAINADSVYRTAENRIEVLTTRGITKQTLAFDDSGGSPTLLHCNRDYLAAVTATHALRVFKVAGREAKPHQGPGLMFLPEMGAGLIVDVLRVNSSGTMVAALCSSAETSREARLFVHAFESQTTLVYDFAKDGKLPQIISWDVVESKVLAVQTLSVARAVDDVLGGDRVAVEVALCFVSPDHGILLQEYQALDTTGAKGFIGLQAPHLIVNLPRQANVGGLAFTTHAAKTLMQGFAGMEDGDDTTKSALLDFSYHLATGNMDEAFRAVRAIKNPAVWENMAHTCIKNKRLDVAEHCLGNMEHTRGARAVREAKGIEELDARVATVAVHLGMMEDARKLYVAAERFDLLNILYQALGQWDKALEVAEKNDRIHLKTTHYAYAKHLEKVGDSATARTHYEKSGCALVEVTRMMYQAGSFDDLEAYINEQSESRQLAVWWARFCESRGDIKRAQACYDKAGDVLSVVRIHCAMQNYSAAEEEVIRLADPAAAFHLARQYESLGRISEAIKFYTQARRYSHGVRLAKTHGLDGDLVNLALKSTPGVMVDAADYLHEKGEHERAAMLYMKGGKVSKAVEMCFAAQLFDVLQHIADDLDSSSADPVLYARCAEFFMQHRHFDKAVKMLIAASQYMKALEMCVDHDVTITEEMAEAMTPSKDALPADERQAVLLRIAKLAKRQGSWQLAAKKYTQAGDKIKAMKALLRSGDTDKIIFFTGVSRQKEIYLMAANYLQTLNWHAEPEIMKNIIGFYTKAQAMDSLAGFFEACAQIEIDEYRDYAKALQAMREALKYLAKSSSEERDDRTAQVQSRIASTEKFVSARALIATQPQQALSLCNELLLTLGGQMMEQESGIRVGDVYALMVEYWYEARNAMEAYKLIEQMRGANIMLTPYLDQRMIDEVYRTLGMQPPQERTAGGVAQQSAGAPGYDEDMVEDEDMVDEDG